MAGKRLLERIRDLEKGADREQAEDVGAEVRSILNHIQCVLNTRQGTAMIADDYGIPDLFYSQGGSSNDMARNIERELTAVLGKYEPRMSNVRVSLVPLSGEALKMHFTISGTLARDASVPVQFSTVVASEGFVTVSD